MTQVTLADVVRVIVLLSVLMFFAVPLVASGMFGFSLPDVGATNDPLRRALSGNDLWVPLRTSLLLAVMTTIGSLVLLVPTLLWLHLRVPRALPVTEALSVLPYVVPAVALVTGANAAFQATVPGFLTSQYSLIPFYVVITMPLVYRAIDNGLRALDVSTLVSASTSLGAGFIRTFISVILPNMRPALLTAAMLSITLVVGEFVLATLLLHHTYPVLLAQLGQDNPRAAAALAVITILGTWFLLAIVTKARLPRLRATAFGKTSS